MKRKSEEWMLIEAAQMRAFYASCGISKRTTESAIVTKLSPAPRKPSPLKGRPKTKKSAA